MSPFEAFFSPNVIQLYHDSFLLTEREVILRFTDKSTGLPDQYNLEERLYGCHLELTTDGNLEDGSLTFEIVEVGWKSEEGKKIPFSVGQQPSRTAIHAEWKDNQLQKVRCESRFCTECTPLLEHSTHARTTLTIEMGGTHHEIPIGPGREAVSQMLPAPTDTVVSPRFVELGITAAHRTAKGVARTYPARGIPLAPAVVDLGPMLELPLFIELLHQGPYQEGHTVETILFGTNEIYRQARLKVVAPKERRRTTPGILNKLFPPKVQLLPLRELLTIFHITASPSKQAVSPSQKQKLLEALRKTGNPFASVGFERVALVKDSPQGSSVTGTTHAHRLSALCQSEGVPANQPESDIRRQLDTVLKRKGSSLEGILLDEIYRVEKPRETKQLVLEEPGLGLSPHAQILYDAWYQGAFKQFSNTPLLIVMAEPSKGGVALGSLSPNEPKSKGHDSSKDAQRLLAWRTNINKIVVYHGGRPYSSSTSSNGDCPKVMAHEIGHVLLEASHLTPTFRLHTEGNLGNLHLMGYGQGLRLNQDNCRKIRDYILRRFPAIHSELVQKEAPAVARYALIAKRETTQRATRRQKEQTRRSKGLKKRRDAELQRQNSAKDRSALMKWLSLQLEKAFRDRPKVLPSPYSLDRFKNLESILQHADLKHHSPYKILGYVQSLLISSKREDLLKYLAENGPPRYQSSFRRALRRLHRKK